MMLDQDKENSKLLSDDRELVLEQIPGEKTTSTTGLVDTRLFKGGNRVRVVKDPTNLLWKFKYDAGALPGALQGHFTTFSRAFDHAAYYFSSRGLRIKEVKA